MKRLSMYFIAALSLLAGANGFAENNCPELNVKNIGDAACATEKAPFLTAPLARVEFRAITPCPAGMWKKKLQAIFKDAKKTYPATEASKTEGKVSCTYKLDEAWKGALNTDDSQLVLQANLPTREHANFWSGPTFGARCPDIESGDVENIKKENGKILVERKRSSGGNLVYEFAATELNQTLGKKILGVLKSLPKGARLTGGKAELVSPFEVQCNYTYHPDGVETKIELKGVQKELTN